MFDWVLNTRVTSDVFTHLNTPTTSNDCHFFAHVIIARKFFELMQNKFYQNYL